VCGVEEKGKAWESWWQLRKVNYKAFGIARNTNERFYYKAQPRVQARPRHLHADQFRAVVFAALVEPVREDEARGVVGGVVAHRRDEGFALGHCCSLRSRSIRFTVASDTRQMRAITASGLPHASPQHTF
jgi:hypothetical protein